MYRKYFHHIDNIYFNNYSNKKNLSFVIAIANILNVNFKMLINAINKFKGLNYRQQIIHKSKKLLIINDSKSTSFSSSIPLLESYKNIYWILGGIKKKGDTLKLDKKYFPNIKAYIYGKDRNFLINYLQNKISCKISLNLKGILKKLIKDIQRDNNEKLILFSPAAASFDQFKNFEERGKLFDKNIQLIVKNIRK